MSRQGGVALLWGTASPMVRQTQLLLRTAVAFWARLLRAGTVQPSALGRYRSWDGCRKNLLFW